MEIFSTEPSLQFLSENFMIGENSLRNGVKDDFRTAFCLETQQFPDSSNQDKFPTIDLDIGQKYITTSKYKFY